LQEPAWWREWAGRGDAQVMGSNGAGGIRPLVSASLGLSASQAFLRVEPWGKIAAGWPGGWAHDESLAVL
jgi:hypothetical protein